MAPHCGAGLIVPLFPQARARVADWRARVLWRLGALWRAPITLGVRLMVLDEDERILLVRHTYTGGWHMPGGGVDPGETAAEAALREVREETGLTLEGTPNLFGLYLNKPLGARDHVALFVLRGVPVQNSALVPQAGEIAAARFAPLSDLPGDTTRATLRRIGEVTGEGAEPSAYW